MWLYPFLYCIQLWLCTYFHPNYSRLLWQWEKQFISVPLPPPCRSSNSNYESTCTASVNNVDNSVYLSQNQESLLQVITKQVLLTFCQTIVFMYLLIMIQFAFDDQFEDASNIVWIILELIECICVFLWCLCMWLCGYHSHLRKNGIY